MEENNLDNSFNLNDKDKKNKSMTKKRRGELIFYFSFLILPIIHYIIFYVCVNINSILLAFKEYKYVDDVRYFVYTTAQFKTIFEEFVYGSALKTMLNNSLVFYLFGLIFIMPLSLIFSFYIYKKCFMSEFFRVMLYLPQVVSSVVMVFMYKFFMDRGVIDIISSLFGIENLKPLSANPNNAMTLVLIYNFIMSFGTSVIMYSSAMTKIPLSVTEYARIDGIKYFREFFSITIPLIFPTISTFLVIGIAGIFTNQANLYAMYGNQATSHLNVATLGYYLYDIVAGKTRYESYPYPAALGIIFTVIVVPLTMLTKKLLDKIDPNVQY